MRFSPVVVGLLWLGAAGLVAAAAPAVDVRVDGVTGELRRNVLALLTIARLPAQPPPGALRVRRAHAQAADEIRTALQPFGFYRPGIRSDLAFEGGAWHATYTIDPGPPIRVGDDEVRLLGDGARDPGFRTAVDGFPLRRGAVFDHRAYETGKEAFEDYAAAHGYLDAAFDVSRVTVDLDRYAADVQLRYATGPRYRFGDVTFRQDVLDPDLLRGYATFAKGEPLDVEKVLRMQTALSSSPYFSRVEVLTDRRHARGLEVPVVVNLVPAARQRWHFGLGYGTDTGPRGTVNYELRRINRRGHRGEGNVVLSGIEKSFSSKYVIPGIYPRTDSLTFAIGYADVRPTTSVQQTGLLGATYARDLGRWRQTTALTLERERYTVGVDSGTTTLLTPDASWDLTVTDDRLYPLHGEKLHFRVRAAQRGLLSDATFQQVHALFKWAQRVSGSVRVLARVEAGRIFTSDLRILPPSSRYFAGGDQSVRGFAYQAIGDRDEKDNVIGGTLLHTASVEADALLIEKFGRWGPAVFYDAGDAATSFHALRRRGAGFGVRWLSPIGMVRLDLAWAVSEPGTPKRIHLSIGPDL